MFYIQVPTIGSFTHGCWQRVFGIRAKLPIVRCDDHNSGKEDQTIAVDKVLSDALVMGHDQKYTKLLLNRVAVRVSKIRYMQNNFPFTPQKFRYAETRFMGIPLIRCSGGHDLASFEHDSPLLLIIHCFLPIMEKYTLTCPYCNHAGFKSGGALTQHKQKSVACRAAILASVGVDNGYVTAPEFLSCVPISQPKTAPGYGQIDDDAAKAGPETIANNTITRPTPRVQEQLDYYDAYQTAREDQSDDDMVRFSDDDDEVGNNDQDANNDDEELAEWAVSNRQCMLQDFKEYVENSSDNAQFTHNQLTAINLMSVLRKTKASLDTYDTVMEWHLRSNNLLHPWESVGKSPHFISRELLFNCLRKRYNMLVGYNNITKIVLPSTRSRATIVHNDAYVATRSLLTDPRVKAEDYLFFDNNPFAPPPADLDYIADLNTGLAYTETWKKRITKPGKQILVPTPLYADSAATGQFADLPHYPLKMSLGIFNRKARDNPHFWRTLGYIPKIYQAKSRGKRLLIESGHVESTLQYLQLIRNEGHFNNKELDKGQDYHSILSVILESLVELQETGMVWDLYYNGVLYKGIELVFFVPFFKCDTDEADKLTGSYQMRGRNVAQLCRYCLCPTNESDNHEANYGWKTKKMIERLVDKGDTAGLRALSQKYIQNALYPLKFGDHNKMSIHGATPMEMLHCMLLGIFKYTRDVFFSLLGADIDCELALEVDALAREYGEILARQSDRNMPKTKFNSGIRKGKIMAKEYTGVLLVLLSVLRSAKGREILAKKKVFRDEAFVLDWIMLLETLLEWEEWLKSDVMAKSDVQSAKKKHRYIMYLIRKIGNRTKGMGLKIIKFHGLLHIATDIMWFGVPLEVDTGSNEVGHKLAKTAAKLTQKKFETFDIQTAKRLEEMDLIGLAMEEIRGRPLWDYWQGYEHDEVMEKDPDPPRVGGAILKFFTNPQTGRNVACNGRKIKCRETKAQIEEDLVDFMVGLQDAVSEHIDSVPLHSYHLRNGQIFRGSHSFLDQVWRDWVLVDWDDYGHLPNKIWGFIDLTQLPNNSNISYGGLGSVGPGFYAVVESSKYVWPDDTVPECDDSELFLSIETEVAEMEGKYVTKMQYYLADVEAFVAPLTVVPNIGGKSNSYFVVLSRKEWREKFIAWLRQPHKYDTMDPINPPVDESSSEDEEDEEEEEDDDVEGVE